MNPIVHIEIPAPDLGAARAFYGEMFGWTFTEAGPDYMIFNAGKDSVGGGFDRQMEPNQDEAQNFGWRHCEVQRSPRARCLPLWACDIPTV